jgi:hypothetical protein
VKSVRTGSGQIHLIGFVATVSQGHSLDSNETNADDNAYHQEGGDSNVIFPLIRSALSMRGIHVGSVAQYVFRHLQFFLFGKCAYDTYFFQVQGHEPLDRGKP